ncbi:MAG: hypothetical protein M1830_009344 [Pleopsidium flavum]|nr:MAG: hypothetical protein M1830_009344 [Pleopsidium flavum]
MSAPFALTTSSRTSVVKLPDETIHLTAKVEGNKQYKDSIRWMISEDRSTEPLPRTNSVQPLWMTVGDAAGRLFKYLRPHQKRSDALVGMLLALSASTEAYLGKRLNTSEIVVPLPLRDGARAYLDDALSAAQLSFAIPTSGSYTFAAQAAARANRIGNCLEYVGEEDRNHSAMVEPQLVLVVDHSRAALTMALAVEEDGCLEYSRIEQFLDLGADQSAGEGYWATVKAHFKEINMAPANADPCVPRTVSRLVMTGDSVLNDSMVHLLEETIGPDLVRDARSRMELPPEYAAAIGAAVASKQRVNGEGA